MTTYVALLRGIVPLNPNMRNEKLRGVFEKLGFTNVRTVISSGMDVIGRVAAHWLRRVLDHDRLFTICKLLGQYRASR